MTTEVWRQVAARQQGLVTRKQLATLGIDRWRIRNQIAAERWVQRTATVIGTTTGALTREQLMWLGVLHAGPPALVGDLTAAEVWGLKNWHRDDVTILLPYETAVDEEIPGIRFLRTRRSLPVMRSEASALPLCRIEPAVLHFAAYQRSRRTAQGLIAAVVQQERSTPALLLSWVHRMRPLRWSKMFQAVLSEIEGGSQSLAELDVLRLCRTFRLQRPIRQMRRTDATGRLRYTDCEWRLRNGDTLVLEVDGAFHMDVQHWEDDLARQRALTAPGRLIVRCTSRELRDEPHKVAADLIALGVPRVRVV